MCVCVCITLYISNLIQLTDVALASLFKLFSLELSPLSGCQSQFSFTVCFTDNLLFLKCYCYLLIFLLLGHKQIPRSKTGGADALYLEKKFDCSIFFSSKRLNISIVRLGFPFPCLISNYYV